MTHPLDPFTYILVDRKPVQHANDDEWFRWFMNMENRRVALAEFGDVRVSTIFNGIERNYGRKPPIHFETAIIGGRHDGAEFAASTWEEAEQNHIKAVALVTQGVLP